jgi:hypothetical protein
MNSKTPHKNRLAILFLLGLFFLSGPTAAAISGAKGLAAAEEAIRAENLFEKIHELASPEMEGRGSGTPGEARAADYIAREFRKIGLKPAGDRESYFQSFDITPGVRLGKDNRLTLETAGRPIDYRPEVAFIPFGFSDEGSLSGEVIFAGYGISAPELNYDDYAGIDVEDKIILVMTHEPQEKNPESPFRKPEAFRYTEVRYKAWNAREHGAKGIILVTDPNGHGAEREKLFAIRGGASADGGPFFSWDGKKIVYRAFHPKTKEEVAEYETLLARNLVKPARAEISLMDADGSNQRQVTGNGAANWAPFMHPDNRRIIFSSNLHDPERRSFSHYLIDTDGGGLERLTYGARFDSFPMFSRDGKKLVFASTRNAKGPREFNIFIADWIP